MPKKSSNKETIKSVDAIRHTDDKRKNIPTIEYRPMVSDDQQSPVPVRYPRNTDLDPQLVWRGKDEQDWSDLVVHAPPLYIQEKVHPKVLIDDLIRMAEIPGTVPAFFPVHGNSTFAILSQNTDLRVL